MAFDRLIKIYARLSANQNAFGEHPLNLGLVAETWAEKVFKRGNEQQSAGQKTGSTVESFRIRYRELSQINVIEHEGIKYDVLSIQEEGRKQFLILECERKDSK